MARVQAFHAHYEDNHISADELLLTVAVFGTTLASPNLPTEGKIIKVMRTRKRIVFEEKFCQAVARLSDIVVE